MSGGSQAAISSQGGLKQRFRWVKGRFHGIETGGGINRVKSGGIDQLWVLGGDLVSKWCEAAILQG